MNLRRMIELIVVLVAASQLSAIAGPPAKTEAQSNQSDPLAASTKLSWQGMSFAVRPPKDYDLSVEQGPDGAAYFFWHGPKRAGGGTAVFSVIPMVRNARTPGLTADSTIETWFQSGKKKAQAMDKTPTKEEKIGGRIFKTTTYRRVEDGTQYNGFMAATETQSGVFAVTAQDVAGQNASLDLGWKALKTFTTTTK